MATKLGKPSSPETTPRLRVALVAPLFESVPPKLYGGTERIVSYLTEELVRQGHAITLYASGDSATQAELRVMCERGLRLDPGCVDPLARHVLMLEAVAAAAPDFDAIHFHTDYWHFPLTRHLRLPALTTLHGRLDIPDLVPLYRQFADQAVVSISRAQRRALPDARWIGTVHHGLPPDLYRFQPRRGDYLAFLGRMSPEKRPDRAIDIARRAGLPLRMAAKVDRNDAPYFKEHIRPRLSEPGVEFIGEIGDHEKNAFLGNAMALLFPIDWPEPFGVVLIEAMACGTPVIAYPGGAVGEIIENGVSGYIVGDIDEAVTAVHMCATLDRALCRQAFERRFTAERMALDYVELYRRVATETAQY